MTSPYHSGELTVQRRAGVLRAAARLAELIQPELPRHADAFLAEQRFLVLGAADGSGRCWATLLTGEAGMVRAIDRRTLHVAASRPGDDPLAEALAGAHPDGEGWPVGGLAIDLGTRRRLRVNGVVTGGDDGGLRLHVREAYWICPKYIQRRSLNAPAPVAAERSAAVAPRRSARLADAQRARIARSDTFFLASAAPRGGADVAHRGGEPGFVRVSQAAEGADVLEFPDYPGNNMFNSFGNLAVNPAAGLLFVDFHDGSMLHLTGTAEVLWEPAEYASWPGAERAVRFRVAEVVERPEGSPLRGRLVERSPFNPPAARIRSAR